MNYDLVGQRGIAICEAVGCTYKQLDYWARTGRLGDDMARSIGSGSRRLWTWHHAELAWVLARVAELSGSRTGSRLPLDQFDHALDLVAARPVLPDGELLVVHADGDAQRCDHWCARPDELDQAVLVIRLRSFAAGFPRAGATGVASSAVEATPTFQ